MPGMLALLLLLTAAPDAGVKADPVLKVLLDDVGHALPKEDAARRAETLKQLDAMAQKAPPKDKAFIERLAKLLRDDPPPEKLLPSLAALLRELARAGKGDFETERVAAGTYGVLPVTARNLSLDPKPYRDDALKLGAALAHDYPSEARAHGVYASVLMQNEGAEKDVLLELKRCADLDPASWCRAQHARFAEQYERPRCTGANLKEALTLTGAIAHYDGKTTSYAEEPKPSLDAADLAYVTVDGAGMISMQTTAAGTQKLEAATARLAKTPDGAMVIKLGAKTLLGAKVLDRISSGSLRVNTGQASMKLDDLCKQLDRPQLPAELKLKTP